MERLLSLAFLPSWMEARVQGTEVGQDTGPLMDVIQTLTYAVDTSPPSWKNQEPICSLFSPHSI